MIKEYQISMSILSYVNHKLDCPDMSRLILRLSIGMLLFHGVHKLLAGVGGIGHMLALHGLPSFIAYGVYIGEVISPILIMLGILTRLNALCVIATMAVAWLLVDVDATWQVDTVGAWAIESLMFYLLAALALLFCGAGRFSLASDKWR